MQHVLVVEGKSIAEELYTILRNLDPTTWGEELERGIRERLNALSHRIRTLIETHPLLPGEQRLTRLTRRLTEMSRIIDEALTTLTTTGERLRVDWRAFRARAYPAYEALAASLKAEAIHVPSLRPTNYSRNLFHVGSGLSVLLLVQTLFTPVSMILVSGGFTLWAWSMEFFRRRSERLNQVLMAGFGPLAHPHEWHRVNSATWYATALFLIALTTGKATASVAVTVLAVGDPAAALIGRRFGRIRLKAGRSLEGTSAFVVSAAAATFLMLRVCYPGLAPLSALILAAGGALAGALAELYSEKVDDNFTIPLAAAAGVAVLSRLMGIALD